jgi:NitT/TauT family transport system permease protein
MPGLLWNMMMSMSGGWFFVVAAEAISVANQSIRLPGVGSYIAMAIEARDLSAIAWVIAFMLAGIALYDQLLFRPLTAWADKFRFEETAGEMAPQSWLLKWLRRTNRVRFVVDRFVRALEYSLWMIRRRSAIRWIPEAPHKGLNRAVSVVLFVAASVALAWLVIFIHDRVGLAEVAHVFLLGFYTLLRVIILIVLAALFWVPVGVWIGLNPRWADRLQGVAQFCAAFPANLMFPVAVVLILQWQLNPDVWLSPLMVLGTQWYLLFNVIAGASGVPTDLRYAVQNLNLSGWLKWRRYLLPAVFPSVVTGAVTASGGCWNASIVAEYVSWGSVTLQAQGLGSYIAHMTAVGDFPRVALGISVMCLFVMCLNRFVWHRLWQVAADRV